MSDEIKNLSVLVEKTEDNKFSVVIRVEGEGKIFYPVDSLEQGEEIIKRCIRVMMPILGAAAERGEYVSFKANKAAE